MSGLLARLTTSYRRAVRHTELRPTDAADLFRPDASRDVFLVTYPRSGTTWISCIAAEMMSGISPRSLDHVDLLVPDIHVLPPRAAVPNMDWYLVKSHFPHVAGRSFGNYRRVIYLIRDPRDVMLSFYRFRVSRSEYDGNLAAFAQDWVNGRQWPCSWHEHVSSWLGDWGSPPTFELTLLRYEEFVANPYRGAEELAGVLNVNLPSNKIKEIVDHSSPSAMRQREARGSTGAQHFIGPATSGSWRRLTSESDWQALRILEKAAGPTMEKHGYRTEL